MNHSIELHFECRDVQTCRAVLNALRGQDFGRPGASVELSAHRKAFKVKISSADIGLLRGVADSYLRYLQVMDI